MGRRPASSGMPTPSEQKALAFAAIVVLLGGAVRVVRAGPADAEPTPSEQQALARQSVAASSAATDQRAAKAARRAKPARLARSRRDAGGKDVAGVVSLPYGSTVPPDLPPGSPDRDGTAGSRFGFPPPGPRIDLDARGPERGGQGRARSVATLTRPIDLDQADEAEIDLLPRVGPALARRIVANRDSLGPFGGLAALRRVRGIGPATLERLAPFVTFSGQARR